MTTRKKKPTPKAAKAAPVLASTPSAIPLNLCACRDRWGKGRGACRNTGKPVVLGYYAAVAQPQKSWAGGARDINEYPSDAAARKMQQVLRCIGVK